MSKTRSIIIPLSADDECDFSNIELLQAVAQEELFRIKGFPYYASAIAPGDRVNAHEDADGFLLFDEVIEASGNSVIQVQSQQSEALVQVQQKMTELDCQSEFYNQQRNMLCVIVPASKSYAQVQQYLIEGFELGKYDFREACISQNHIDKEGNNILLD